MRALLLDPADQILLLRGRDPGVANPTTWWFTPGGGINPDEQPLAALRRECWEELGYVPEQFHGPIARRRYCFEFDKHWLVQDTEYFWARVPAFDPMPQHLSELEKRFLLGWRWWPQASLAATTEVIYPEDLTGLIVGLR